MIRPRIINNKYCGFIDDNDDRIVYDLNKDNPVIPENTFLTFSGIPSVAVPYFTKSFEYRIFCELRRQFLKEKFGANYDFRRGQSKEARQKYHGVKAHALRVTNKCLAGARQNADIEAIKLARRFKEERRGAIYKLACKPERLKQFIDVYPVAGLMLAQRIERGIDPDTPYMIEDIYNGIKLNTIVNKYNYPDISFKKVKPLAAGIIADIIRARCGAEGSYDLLKKLINCYLPKQSMLQYRFAIMISNFFRNLEYRGRDNNLRWQARQENVHSTNYSTIEWFIKNIDFSKNLGEISLFASDIEDYIFARNKYNVREFNSKMNLSSVIEASKLWHERIANDRRAFAYANQIPEDTEFSQPWIDEYSDDEYSIVPLKTVKDLIKEGVDMHHCVSSYAKRIIDNKCYIYSVYRSNKKIATLELAKEVPPTFTTSSTSIINFDNVTAVQIQMDGANITIPNSNNIILEQQQRQYRYMMAQLRGPCNKPVDEQVSNMVRSWIANANKMLQKETAVTV